MIIEIVVADKRPTVLGTPIIVCGNSDYTISFDFDEEWASHTEKVARFVYYKNSKTLFQDVPFSGAEVAVPVLSGIDFVLVGVYAGNLCTTTPARVWCDRSILCGTSEQAPLTPSQYDEIMELLAGGVGLGTAEKKCILSLFKAAAYTEDVSAKVAELEALWSVSYKVSYSLTGATASNDATAVVEGAAYTTTLTAEGGYTLTGATVKVIMGGKDITSTAYSNGVINIATVTGNVVITVAAREIPSFTITNNLTNVTNSNSATKVTEGDFYSANLSWAEGYDVNSITITMGGVDVTADVYGEGKILITEVTGDVVITAEAGLPAPVYLLENKTFDGSAGQIIDTGIALFDKQKDWSIYIALTTDDETRTSGRTACWHKSAESAYSNGVSVARGQWANNWSVSAVTNGYQVSDNIEKCAVIITHTKGANNHQYYGVIGGEIVTGNLSTRGVGTDGTLKIGGGYDYEETTENNLLIGTINTAEVHLRVLSEGEIKTKLLNAFPEEEAPILYQLANTPMTCNADLYEDTGLTFGASNANGVKKAWTVTATFSQSALTTLAGVDGAEKAFTIAYNYHQGQFNPGVYCANGLCHGKTTQLNKTFKLVITHEAGATGAVTVYSDVDGLAGTVSATYNNLTSSVYAGNLFVGGRTGADFKGIIEDFTIYNSVLSEDEINAYLGVA